MDWIRKKSAETLNPAQVENTLGRIAADWPVAATPLHELFERFPLGDATTRGQARGALGLPESAFVVGSFVKDGVGLGEGSEPKLAG